MGIVKPYRISPSNIKATSNKDWSLLSEFEKAAAKKEVTQRLSERGALLMNWLSELDDEALQIACSIFNFIQPAAREDGGANLISRILEPALNEAHKAAHENSPKDVMDTFVTFIVRELYQVFDIKVCSSGLNGKPAKARIWDCTESGMGEWMSRNKFKSAIVEQIQTEWTSITRQDAGLLLARHIITPSRLANVYAKTNGTGPATSHPVVFHSKVTKQGLTKISDCLKNQMQSIDFIDPSIKILCDRFIGYFTNAFSLDGDIPFVEIELSRALAAWHATYKAHGASTAYIRFCKRLLESLLFAFRLRVSTDEGEHWEWSDGPLVEWVAKRSPNTLSISISPVLGGLPSKQTLLLSHIIFSRQDLSIWRLPMPGKARGNFWGDFVHDFSNSGNS
jgi:hypothetical protein